MPTDPMADLFPEAPMTMTSPTLMPIAETPMGVASGLVGTDTKLDKIINDAELAMVILSSMGAVINPAVPAAAALANRLLSALAAGVRAHEAIAGKPLDLSLLHHIDPVV